MSALGDQAEPSCHIPSLSELPAVASRCDDSGGREWANAGDRPKTSCPIVLCRSRCDLSRDGADALLEPLEILKEIGQEAAHRRREVIALTAKDPRQVGFEPAGTLVDCHPVLRQKALIWQIRRVRLVTI